MNSVAIASTEADSSAERAIRNHHAEMSGALGRLTGGLLAAAAHGDRAAARSARTELLQWCVTELVPHAAAEESVLYRAAGSRPEGRLLTRGLIDEHAVITGLVEEITRTEDVVHAAGAARALQTVFDAHAAKENDLVLPLLAADPEVSLATLLEDMHADLTALRPAATEDSQGQACGSGHGCGCGGADEPGFPELDARSIPHAIRHVTILGALSAAGPDGGLVLLAPHDPLPLLREIEQRWPGRFAVEYRERGPQTWRLALTRTA